ncbi:AsmA-like C-terminal region-containing protein [Fulvivirgaceae bacterium BMA10]|uniref:AsmA-like C-terminal region-containing protein n=1 Tax=Splendidivirga corallicola TaxID=3051826 RepID=A0ABT8KKP2_9BACT|nr:AsmA-like C-terminal region-containing protein [Fulvivirgaceae bacterium BMA10]
MGLKKRIRKLFTYISLTVVLLLLAGIGFTMVYQDRIVNLFIEEANGYLNTPISVKKIELSVLKKFPHMAIVLEDVSMQESLPASKNHLASVKKIYLTFSLLDLIRGKYVVNQAHLEDADVQLRITKSGKLNYNIVKKNDEGAGGEFSFNFQKLKLDNIDFSYINERKNQEIILAVKSADSRFAQIGRKLDIQLKGDLESKEISIQDQAYFKDKHISLNTSFQYDLDEALLDFSPSNLKIRKSNFIVNGAYKIDKVSSIDLAVRGENTDFQTLLSLLPEKYSKRLSAYRSDGDVYFNGSIKGDLGRDKSPSLQINFGCNNASFFHPEYKKKLTNASLTGSFNHKKINDLASASLMLEGINAKIDNRGIEGSFFIENFKEPFLDCAIKASFEVGALMEFLPLEAIKEASGNIDMDVKVNGRLRDLKRVSNANRVKSSGAIKVRGLNFSLKENALAFRNFNGNLSFSNSDLTIKNLSGGVGSSDFKVSGNFKNFIALIIAKQQPIIIEADLKSRFINLDELLLDKRKISVSDRKETKYFLDITPRLSLLFNCHVEKLKFKRFNGRKIRGALRVKNQIANTNNLYFQAAGGTVRLKGSVSAKAKNALLVSTDAVFNQIHIDSIFHIFENFNQNFLVDHHLRGQIDASVQTKMGFNKHLKWFPGSLVADVQTSIKNGELNNFEPMQKVSRFIRKESLSHLRFSELRNNIRIENKTIYLPPMEVSSNVRTIEVQGTHTFDQLISYNLKVPIKNASQRDKDEAFGAIEKSGEGQSNLFLSIKGTAKDYRITYDSKAVANKIKGDLKKEGQELKNIFKNKGKKKETLELNEDEYFEFDSLDHSDN